MWITKRARLFFGWTALGMLGIIAAGCGRPYIAPILPSSYRETLGRPYEVVWDAIVRAVARENIAIRTIARDSGVISSDDFPTPIGVYADCGGFGNSPVTGEAQITFTVFVQRQGNGSTAVQVNTKMRSESYRRGTSGKLRRDPPLTCVSTGRWELNFLRSIRTELAE